MNTSQFMDKQIMDLSSQSHKEFIDLLNPQEDARELLNPQEDARVDGGVKKEEILPSYDFQPIRPTNLPSSPPNFDSSVAAGGGLSAWNSADNKKSGLTLRDYVSHKGFKPAKVVSEKDSNTVDTNLLSEIECIVKKYSDNLLLALDGVNARLSQLESRTHLLENFVDDLSVSVENNHGSSDGKMRQLEHLVKEVQNGVQDIKDKQEIMDAHLQLTMLQVSKVEQHEDTQQKSEPLQSSHSAYSTAQLSHQALLVQPPSFLIPPNAPPPPPPSHQNVLNTGQLPNNFAPNQGPRQEPYFPPPGQTPENPTQSFQVPSQQLQPRPPPPQPYAPPHSQYSQLPASPRQSIMSNANHPQHTPTSGYHSEETPYMQSQSYPPNIRAAAPPQYYGPPPPNLYEPTSSRPSAVFSGAYGPSPASSESYPYNNPSQYNSITLPMKPQLPTARPLPHASGVSNAVSGNKVPIDDVIERVTNMGFPRDHVRATVRQLTDNGQAVDLNVVLDKLMNPGPSQEPWRP